MGANKESHSLSGHPVELHNGNNRNDRSREEIWQQAVYFFLPFDLEVELVEVTLDARDGAAELPLLFTLSRALFCDR